MPHFEFVQVPLRAANPPDSAGEGSLDSDPESAREDSSTSGSWPLLSRHVDFSGAKQYGGYLRGTDSSDDEGLY